MAMRRYELNWYKTETGDGDYYNFFTPAEAKKKHRELVKKYGKPADAFIRVFETDECGTEEAIRDIEL